MVKSKFIYYSLLFLLPILTTIIIVDYEKAIGFSIIWTILIFVSLILSVLSYIFYKKRKQIYSRLFFEQIPYFLRYRSIRRNQWILIPKYLKRLESSLFLPTLSSTGSSQSLHRRLKGFSKPSSATTSLEWRESRAWSYRSMQPTTKEGDALLT